MNTKSKILKAALISLLIWFPIHILFLLTTAIIMMVTGKTLASYLIASAVWGAVLGIPFLVLAGKSHFSRMIKLGLMIATVFLFALLLNLLFMLLSGF